MQPSSPPLSPSSISRFSSPSMIPDSHIAAMLVLVNKPDTHSYPVFHVQKDPPPDIQAKGVDGEPITAYDQIVIGSDFESDLRMFFAEPKHCSLIVDYLGNIHILNFSGDNPCQLNSLPLSTDTLHPLKDMDVIHVAGKDFRVEYKPGYPIDSQPPGDSPRERVLPPSSPKILNLSPSLIDPTRYSSPPRPDTPEQYNSPTDENPANSPSNSTASLESVGVQEPEAVQKVAELPQVLLDLSPAPSPKRTVCPLDTADNSSASMECNTTQPSMFVKDMSTMDVSVEASEKRRRISDFPKKTISSPIKLKRKSAPLHPTRHSIQFSEQNMDTSTDSPVRRRSPRIQCLKLEPSTPGKTQKKPSKQPSATPQSSHKSKSPLSSISQKSVRFGPKLSPEEFDRRLPPSTPVKRGGTPRSATRAVLRRSTPYKVRIPLCADLDSTRERRSTSLSPRRAPLRNSPNVAGRIPLARALPEIPIRLQRKGLGSRLLTEISESQRFKRSARISTPTSIKAKGSRIPKPLQSALGANQSIASLTLTSRRGVKGRIGLRNPKSPEKSLKQIPALTLSVKLEKPPNSNNQIGAKESSKSPQNKPSKLPEPDVMTSPVPNPEPIPSPQTRRSVSPRNFYSSQRSQDSSPEFQTPPSRDGSRLTDRILSPKGSGPANTPSKSAPRHKSPKGRALTPKSPAFGSSGKVIEKSRTPALRSSSRLSTPSDNFASTNSNQENTPISTSTVSPKSLPTEAPVTPRTRSRSLVSPSAKSKSPSDPQLLSPRVSTSTKSPLARSTPESPEQTPIPSPRTPTPRSAIAHSRSTPTPVPRSRDSTPQISKPRSSSSPGLTSAKNTPTPNSRSRNATPRSGTPITKSSPPSSTYQTPTLRSRTPNSTSETPNLRSRTPSSNSETPIPLSASPDLVLTKSPPVFSPRTPKSRSATASRSRSTTPTSTSNTPKSRSATAGGSRSTTPTKAHARASPMSPSSELSHPISISISRASISSGNSPLPVSPSSPVSDLRRSPRLAWESPSLETRSLTPLSIHLNNERAAQRVGTPRPASTAPLRKEDACLPRQFKTPKTKHRTSQPELNFRPSLFDISESETESPQRSPVVNKRSQSLPRRGLELSEIPRKKNIALAEDNFNPYMFRSPRSKSAPQKTSEDNFDPHMFRSPHSRPQHTPQKPSEDNFDSELFRSPPTPSFSGGRGTKRSAAKQSPKISAKVSRSNESVLVEVSPLRIRETRRMLREKQTASSRAVKRRSDSGDKSSPVKILVLDSPTPLQPEEPSPPMRRRTRSRIVPVAAPPILSSPPPPLTSPPTLPSPAPVRVTRQKKVSSPTAAAAAAVRKSPVAVRRRTRSSKTPFLVNPVPIEISPTPIRVTRQRKPAAASGGTTPVDVDPVIVSPVLTKKTLRSNKAVSSSKSKQPSKGILKTPSKRQKFSDKTSPSLKLTGRHRVRTKTTRVNFASPQPTIPAERSPPPRPPTPQKNIRKLRSQDSPKSVRVTRRAK